MNRSINEYANWPKLKKMPRHSLTTCHYAKTPLISYLASIYQLLKYFNKLQILTGFFYGFIFAPRGYMRPFLFGSNHENGKKKVCSKTNFGIILFVFIKFVFVLEDLLLERSNLTMNFMVYFLLYPKNSWFNQEVLG